MHILIIVLFVVGFDVASGQIPSKRNNLIDGHLERVTQPNLEVRKTFEKIERGVETGSIESLYALFPQQLSVSLDGNESGVFSNNQAAALLRNYFSLKRPISFSFTRISDKASNPYATGTLVYVHKGNRETAQIYVSLAERDSRWVVKQFNIY